jgi:hypothetical protein
MSAPVPWGMPGSGGRASRQSRRSSPSSNCTTHERNDVPQVPTSTEPGGHDSPTEPASSQALAACCSTSSRVLCGRFRCG